MEVKPRRSSEKGFTLIESMVALTILLVGLLALAMMQNVAFRANTYARNRTNATILASERIERLSRLGAGNFAAGTASSNVEGRNFSQTWTTATAPAVTNNAQSVQVQVNWSDAWHSSQSVQFPTVVR